MYSVINKIQRTGDGCDGLFLAGLPGPSTSVKNPSFLEKYIRCSLNSPEFNKEDVFVLLHVYTPQSREGVDLRRLTKKNRGRRRDIKSQLHKELKAMITRNNENTVTGKDKSKGSHRRRRTMPVKALNIIRGSKQKRHGGEDIPSFLFSFIPLLCSLESQRKRGNEAEEETSTSLESQRLVSSSASSPSSFDSLGYCLSPLHFISPSPLTLLATTPPEFLFPHFSNPGRRWRRRGRGGHPHTNPYLGQPFAQAQVRPRFAERTKSNVNFD